MDDTRAAREFPPSGPTRSWLTGAPSASTAGALAFLGALLHAADAARAMSRNGQLRNMSGPPRRVYWRSWRIEAHSVIHAEQAEGAERLPRHRAPAVLRRHDRGYRRDQFRI